jgi:hypothetical protein
MSLVPFLRQLFDHGRVTVETADVQRLDERDLNSLLQLFDAEYRCHLPEGLPALNLPAASWGAKTLYSAAQVLAYRDLGIEAIQQVVQPTRLQGIAGEQFSVDLCLRYLPDLVRLARAASANDPLVTCLLELGADWPLSSVGIAGLALSERGIARVNALPAEPAVWRLYIDRVLQTGDSARLADPATRTAVRQAVGAFPQLAGKLAKELEARQTNQEQPAP